MNRDEWIAAYEPKTNGFGELIRYDVVEDIDFVTSQPESYVWTEIWDFDSERPWLVGGCVLDENGGLSWYVCNKPWSADQLDPVEWNEE